MAATVRKGIKISGVCLFLLYLTGLVYFLFFAEEYGRSAAVVGYNTRPFREILRSKKVLDNLTILNAPKNTVVRDGQEQVIAAEELVLERGKFNRIAMRIRDDKWGKPA